MTLKEIPTKQEIIKLLEEGIKEKAIALIISYKIAGMINKKDIKYEYAFSKEEIEHIEEENSKNWRRIEKTYHIQTIKDIAETIYKNNTKR